MTVNRMRLSLSAGVVDTGLSSLATFLIGLYAIRYLSPVELGAYALAFSAFMLAANIPTQLFFSPLEVAAVSHDLGSRLTFLRKTLRFASLPSLVSGLAVVFWIGFVPSEVPSAVVWALTLTGIACAALSPVQDHVRNMFHIAEQSWLAAMVSLIHVVTVLLGITLFLLTDLPVWWCPFGVLAAANVTSLLGGIGLARMREAPDSSVIAPRFNEISRLGGWLLLSALIPNAATFLAAAFVAGLAGAQILGYAEAARVVAMPMLVFARGISAVIGPRLMAAARTRDSKAAKVQTALFVRLMTIAALAYVVIVGHDWVLSPFSWLTPLAYQLPGLVAFSILSHLVQGFSYSGRAEMLGSHQGAQFAKIEMVINILRVAIAPTAAWIGAYAIPLSGTLMGGGRVIGYGRAMRVYYASADSTAAVAEPRDALGTSPSLST